MNTKTKKATPKASTKAPKVVATTKTKTVKATTKTVKPTAKTKSTPKIKKSNRVTVSVVQYTPKGRRIRGYKSLTAASTTTGVNVGSISKVVRGIGQTAGGFRWANA
jgi:hypothetical protein